MGPNTAKGSAGNMEICKQNGDMQAGGDMQAAFGCFPDCKAHNILALCKQQSDFAACIFHFLLFPLAE